MSKESLQPELWVDTYSDYFLYYTLSRVSDREVAKDIVSETFLAGLKSKANFEGRSTEKTWLTSILNRKIIDHYRKINSNKGQAEVKMNYAGEDQEGSWLEEQVANAGSTSADFSIENKELGEAILACLEQIHPKHAEIFKMKTLQNYDNDVICKEMGITSSNLWVIIHRARKALASCLDSSWF
ncbi:sigma-70 family RNA polymerase sigma factor [Psychroflexus sp. YR1-1]|uniref:Sigma-70 family RNA polymerase sigma factor n=1 Tax=Psychroflexus aurantiacus TaxID=2709310 RepID=A0A6B3R8K1_9FLAO|nr:sigma-70 family RNA polymerase sigma factor [Psychroflexus aurantiacus]NEV93961.1 sigma-70 family RNA polymerase sigma factor [Psychroflexus aurantiacus]